MSETQNGKMGNKIFRWAKKQGNKANFMAPILSNMKVMVLRKTIML